MGEGRFDPHHVDRGAYKVKVALPAQSASHSYRAIVPKQGRLNAAVSKTIKLAALAKVAAALTVTPSTVLAGDSVVASGTVAPFVSGTTVTIQRQVGAAWVTQATTPLSASGTFTTTLAVSATTNYRASVPRVGLKAAAVSPTRTVTATPVPPAPAPTVTQISGGGQHNCRVKTDQTLWCWGYNFSGQLGRNVDLQNPRELRPKQVGTNATWTQIASGGAGQQAHTCAIRQDHSLWCWGHNFQGQLGVPNASTDGSPRLVDGGRLWASVSTGDSHTCGITTRGVLWCWGGNAYGQLGTDSTGAARAVDASTDWAAVSAGFGHTCATKTSGQLWCWGSNFRGELGTGGTPGAPSPASSGIPVRVGLDSNWDGISVSHGTSCGHRTTGAIWCWGYNAHGETGTGSPGIDRVVPTQVGSATDWEGVSASGYSSAGNQACATKTSGQLWCWGFNGDGQLGTGDNNSVSVPKRVGAATDWASVTTGGGTTYAVKDDGSEWTWGSNSNGQLGINSGVVQSVNVPTAVVN